MTEAAATTASPAATETTGAAASGAAAASTAAAGSGTQSAATTVGGGAISNATIIPPKQAVSTATPSDKAAADAKAAETAAAAAKATEGPKRLISFDEAATKTEAAKTEVTPADWKLELPKDAPIGAPEFEAMIAKAKSLNLSKDQANAMVETRIAHQKAETNRVNDAWHAEAMADSEIGGDKMPAVLARTKQVLMAIATPAERKAIADSPFANNPLFLRMMNRAHALLPVEDTVHSGQPPAVGKQYPRNQAEAAAAMYPGRKGK